MSHLAQLTERYWKAVHWFEREDISEARKLMKLPEFEKLRFELRTLEKEIEDHPKQKTVLEIFGGVVMKRDL